MQREDRKSFSRRAKTTNAQVRNDGKSNDDFTNGKNAEAPIDNEVAWVAVSPKVNDIAVEESTPPRYCC